MMAPHFRWLNLLVILALFAPRGSTPVKAAQPAPETSGEPGINVSNAPAAPSGNVDLRHVGQIGGGLRVVTVQGNYAYVGVGAQLVVLNITNPSEPVVMGKSPLLSGVIQDISIEGAVVYIAATTGMAIVNVSDPLLPYVVGEELPLPASGLAADTGNSLVYVAGGQQLSVVDITGVSPSLILSYTYTSSAGWDDIVLNGIYAYMTGGNNLLTLNVTSPSAIVLEDTDTLPGLPPARQMALDGSSLYVPACEQGMLIFSLLSNPAQPTIEGTAHTQSGCAFGVQVSGEMAYVATGLSGLLAFNVSLPSSPFMSGQLDTPGLAMSLALSGSGFIYLADNDALRSINVAIPASPSPAGQYITYGQADHVVAVDNQIYVMDQMSGGGLRAYDVFSPTQAIFQSSVDNPWTYTTNLTMLDGFAYYADQHLNVLDLSEPAYPYLAGSLELPFAPRQVAAFSRPVEGRRYVAIAAGADGLQIVDVSDRKKMRLVGAGASGDAQGVTIFETRAYVADGVNGLQIFDLSDPAAPVLQGTFNTPGFAHVVTVVGGAAYVADGGSGLQIVNVNTPTNPTLFGQYNTPGEALDVRVLGRYAFIADGLQGIHVIDVNDPSAPLWDSSFPTPGNVTSLAVADGYVYAAAGDAGLQVYQPTYLPAYILSGRVVDGSGNPVSGVALASPGSGYIQHSNANGEYLFFHMPAGTHQVRPSKTGYRFTPGVRSPILPPAASGQDFTATPLNYPVAGRVIDSRGLPMAGVTVADGLGNSTTTDSDGNYALSLAVGPHHFQASLGQAAFWPQQRLANVPPGLEQEDFTMPAPISLAAYRYGGNSRIVARQGNWLYMDTGPGLTVLNISKPYTPTLMGKTAPLPGVIRDLALNGQYAYAALDFAGLAILDLSKPTQPALANLFPLRGKALGVAIAGSYLFVSLDTGLHVFNLANPVEPMLAGSLHLAGGGALAVSAGVAYLETACNGLTLVNISTPGDLSVIGSVPLPGCVQDLVVSGNYVYLALSGNTQGGLHVLDLAAPQTPVMVYSEALDISDGRLMLDGSYLYYGAGWQGLNIYAVADPMNITLISNLPVTGFAYSMAVNGTSLYLASGDNGLNVIDVSDRTKPGEAGFYRENLPENTADVVVQGAYAYLAGHPGGFQVYDVTNPHKPMPVGQYENASDATSLAVQGKVAYVGSGENGMYILNIAEPLSPTLLSKYSSSGSVSDVAVAGDYAYLTGNGPGLQIVQISNPSAPTQVGAYSTITGTQAIKLVGGLAYVIHPALGLHVIDISTPTNPVEIGSYDPPQPVYGVDVVEGRVYLATQTGLVVLDAANLSTSPLGQFETWMVVYDVRAAGHFAYLATQTGLFVLNISQPQRMVEANFILGAESQNSRLALDGKFLYLAHSAAGLLVYSFNGPRPSKLSLPGGANNSPQTLVIRGANFQLGAQAFLGNHSLGSVTVISATQITAVVPAGLVVDTYPLAVINPDGGKGFLPLAYTVYLDGPPQVDRVVPKQGTNNLPAMADVFGSNFAPGATVALSGPQNITIHGVLYIDATHLRLVLPPGLATGAYDLTVTNPGGQGDTLSAAYTVRIPAELDDLYAFEFDIFLRPHFATLGAPIEVALNLRRQGGVTPLANIPVDFYDGDPQAGGTLLGRGIVAGMLPGRVVSTTSVTWTPTHIGPHRLFAVIDPGNQAAENVEDNNTIQRMVAIYWESDDAVPPNVIGLSINQGIEITSDPLVTLNTVADDNAGGSGVRSLLFVEYEYIKSQGGWMITAISDWLPYEDASQDYPWKLTPSPGIHYIQAWAADRAGNISPLPASQPINYLPETVPQVAGEIHTFRLHLSAGDDLQASLTSLAGDADLYIFAPDGRLMGKSETGGLDNANFTAPVAGLYQIEVEAVIESSYQLVFHLNGSSLPAVALSARPDKPHQPHPRGRVQPDSDPGDEPGGDVGIPSPSVGYILYLPLTTR